MEATYAQLAWIVPLAPLIAFLVLLAIGRQVNRHSAAVGVAATLVSFIFAVLVFVERLGAGTAYAWQDWDWLTFGGTPIGFGYEVNNLNALMLVIVSGVSLLVNLYSAGYMKGDPRYHVFFGYVALFTFSMLGLVLSSNLLELYVFWELVGVCSFLLIGFWYHKPEAKAAAKKAFIVTRIGDAGLLIAILILFWQAPYHDLSFTNLANAVAEGMIAPGILTLTAILIFVGAVGKSGQFPLHVWLPDAMEGPTPISALIHAATMVAAGVYLVARTFFIFEESAAALTVVAVVGAFTALFAATVGVAQTDIKRVLAYSTVSQLGYMMMALGVGAQVAAVFHLTTHAFFKALLFLAAGSVIHAVGKQDVGELGGLGRKMKVTAWTFGIGALALAGLFPLSGFWSKDAILTAALHKHAGYFMVGLVAAFFTAFYMARLFFLVFAGKPRSAYGHEPHESPAVMTVPLVILAALAVVSGFIYTPFNSWLGDWLTGAPAAEHANWTVILLSNLAALLGIGLGWLMYGKRSLDAEAVAARMGWLHKLVKNKYYIDELYRAVIVKPVKALGDLLHLADRFVVDGVVKLVAGGALFIGRVGTRMQNGQLQGYGLVSLLGLVLLMALLAGRRFFHVG